MKKVLIFFVIFFCAACSTDTESPVITVERLLVNENVDNYANHSSQLPTLNPGDEVLVFLTLDGNGSDLKSFQVTKDKNIDTGLVYPKEEISSDKNFSDPEKGQLRFINGVATSHIMVRATVTELDKDGGAKLNFYLSSKSQSSSAQKVIDLKVAKP